jgi:putative ABC transport system ATP-binding protein
VVGGQLRVDAAELRRTRIGFVFQKANLIPFLSALDNVLVAFEINEVRGRGARRKAHELLDYLGLADRADHLPDELSGGQQQRVAIARALAMEPAIVLADEPTAALDSHRSRDVMDLFRHVAHERGTAVLVVTHDHRALDAFDTVHEMEDGVLRTTGERGGRIPREARAHRPTNALSAPAS